MYHLEIGWTKTNGGNGSSTQGVRASIDKKANPPGVATPILFEQKDPRSPSEIEGKACHRGKASNTSPSYGVPAAISLGSSSQS